MRDPKNIYQGDYKEFIENILSGKIENDTSNYCENHHIIARCTFDDSEDEFKESKDNQILLEYKNHFIAHRILAKDNPHIIGLVIAYWLMCKDHPDLCTPEEYAEMRKSYSKILSKRNIGNNYHLGKTHSEETRKKMSENHADFRGENHPRYGTTWNHTEESRRKISDSLLGHPVSEETRVKHSRNMQGNRRGLGNRSHTGMNTPQEVKDKIANSLRGRKRPKLEYHLKCIICDNEFIGNSPNSKYCERCKVL